MPRSYDYIQVSPKQGFFSMVVIVIGIVQCHIVILRVFPDDEFLAFFISVWDTCGQISLLH